MKAILQRVTKAKVEVDSKTVGEIGTGFLILLGVENGDTEKEADALAAKIAGERPWRVITVEILPNLLPVMGSQFVFSVIMAILSESSLSFIGLGSTQSFSLGTMLYYAQNGSALNTGAWWWFLPPGLMIAIIGAGLSFINFSIDEVINPRLRKPTKKSKGRKG